MYKAIFQDKVIIYKRKLHPLHANSKETFRLMLRKRGIFGLLSEPVDLLASALCLMGLFCDLTIWSHSHFPVITPTSLPSQFAVPCNCAPSCRQQTHDQTVAHNIIGWMHDMTNLKSLLIALLKGLTLVLQLFEFGTLVNLALFKFMKRM